MAQQIQHRRDTATNWSTINPILAEGEIGIDLTNNKYKIGDGITAWNTLSYASSSDSSALKITNNLSDLSNTATARTNIGLGNVANVNQIPMSYLTTDGTLSSNSDVLVPSEKAVKTYVDSGLSSKIGKDPSVINVSDVGGDFTTISAAISYINTQSPSANNQYVISVGSGLYVEPVLVVPAWTSIRGSTINSTIIQPSASNHNVFELPNNTCELSFMTIQGAGTGYCGVYSHNPGNFIQMHKVSMYDNDTHIKLIADSVDSILYLEYVDIDNVYSNGIKIQSSNGFLAKVNAENFYTLPTAAVSGSHLTCDGSNAQLYVLSGGLLGTADVGIEVVNGGYLSAQAIYMRGFSIGILASSFGAGATLDLSDIDFDSNTIDIAASNANTLGQFTGFSEVGKITKHSSATFSVTLDLKENLFNKSDDRTLSGHSSILYPTQAAVKDYADTKVTSNSAITAATKTKITYDSKGLVTSGADANLDDLGDVIITSPITSDILVYNGTKFINQQLSIPTSAGAGVNFYLTATASGISGYDYMSKIPDSATEVIETVSIPSGAPTLMESYISNAAIGGSVIDAGQWIFNIYAFVGSTSGSPYITVKVYSRTTGGTETLLFSADTVSISTTSIALYTVTTTQPSFTINPTDLLVFKFYGTQTGGSTINMSLVHSGTTHYTSIHSPLVTRHNDLSALQGGNSTERFHLTSTEYTGTGTGNFVRETSPTITSPTISSPTITSPTISGATHIGAETYDVEGVLNIISKDSSKSRMIDWSTTASGTLYTTIGDFIMWGISHNFGIDSSGNILGRDDADECQMLIMKESGDFEFWYAPTGSAGTIPSFSKKATINKDGFTGTIGTVTPSAAIVTTLNNLVLSAQTAGFTISGGTASKTLTVSDNATVSGTNTGDQTTITGNAGSATILQTARTISGQSFDGSANITIDHTGLSSIGTNTHAQIDTALTRLANTSGTNTGDQDLSGLVPKTTTVNGHSLSSNVTVTQSDVGLSNVNNTADTAKPIAGDVTGTLSSSSVVKLQNRILASTAPTSKQAIAWNSTSSQWEPQTIATMWTANTVSASTITLTSSSNRGQVFTGTVGGQIVKLPDATTLSVGDAFYFINKSDPLIQIIDSASTFQTMILPTKEVKIVLVDNTTTAGIWAISNYGLDYGIVKLFDDFVTASTATLTLGSLGWTLTTGTVASQTAVGNSFGVIRLSSSTANNGLGALSLGTTTPVLINNSPTFIEQRVSFPAIGGTAANQFSYHGGLLNATTVVTPGTNPLNAIGFAYHGTAATAGNIFGFTSSATLTTTVDSGIQVVAGSWYKLSMIINAAGTQAYFYVNNTYIGTSTTNMPTAIVMAPQMKVSAGSTNAAAKTTDIDFYEISKLFTNSR